MFDNNLRRRRTGEYAEVSRSRAWQCRNPLPIAPRLIALDRFLLPRNGKVKKRRARRVVSSADHVHRVPCRTTRTARTRAASMPQEQASTVWTRSRSGSRRSSETLRGQMHAKKPCHLRVALLSCPSYSVVPGRLVPSSRQISTGTSACSNATFHRSNRSMSQHERADRLPDPNL